MGTPYTILLFLKYTWNKTSGLPDDCVYYAFEDSGENLCLCVTTTGLFYLESPCKFSPINGINDGCWDLASTGDALLVATSGGVFLVDKEKNNQYPVIKDPAFVLRQSTYRPGRIWCGTGDGLVALYRENGQWREESRFQSINQEIRSVAEEKTVTCGSLPPTGAF